MDATRLNGQRRNARLVPDAVETLSLVPWPTELAVPRIGQARVAHLGHSSRRKIVHYGEHGISFLVGLRKHKKSLIMYDSSFCICMRGKCTWHILDTSSLTIAEPNMHFWNQCYLVFSTPVA